MTDLATSGLSNYTGSTPSVKPMLARVAESTYWMALYVERAEHIARMIHVNSNVLIDVGDVDPQLEQNLWHGVLRALYLDQSPKANAVLAEGRDVAARLGHFLTFDPENPSSLLNCLTRARENARSIRETISGEMWEALNTLYWNIRGEEAQRRFEESPQEVFQQVMLGSFLFQGLTNQTIPHSQGWLFSQLAKHMERCDITCRTIETKFDILNAAEGHLDEPLWNIHWMAVLRSCCSIEEFRRTHPGHIDPDRVAAFLILAQRFPRSIGYSVRHAHEAAAGIRASVNPHLVGGAERILARLHAQLENADPNDFLVASNVQTYLRNIVTQIKLAADAVHKAYFLR
jgi:uncharacterized alpha-E superfamily protein